MAYAWVDYYDHTESFSYYPELYALLSLLVFVTLTEAIIAIISSAFGCRGVYACCCNNSSEQPMVFYYTAPGQAAIPHAGPLLIPTTATTASPQAIIYPSPTGIVIDGNQGGIQGSFPIDFKNPATGPITMATATPTTIPTARLTSVPFPFGGVPNQPQATTAAAAAWPDRSPPPSYKQVDSQQATSDPQQPTNGEHVKIDVSMPQPLV